MSFRFLLLPGDGIGPEVMAEVERLLTALAAREGGGLDIRWETAPVGGASYDLHGAPLTPETLEKARRADAVLLGAVGGPKWEALDFALRPERALLALRKELALFANLRPAVCFAPLVAASSLKPELVAGLDLLIVRELTGGIYFGEPRGIEELASGERRGVNTQVYDTHEIIRVAEVAFALAEGRSGRLLSVEKSNVMESGLLWREEVSKLGRERWPHVALSHMYADACAMQLVRAPKQFDVIVTDNLFGDLLSDAAAMLTGSLGMLPSASLGAEDETGRRAALYEPVHGSAPDIAGTGAANPLACILSLAMALRWTCKAETTAKRLEAAVEAVLDAGLRTADLMPADAEGAGVPSGGGPGEKDLRRVSTAEMGEAVLAAFERG